LQSAKRRDRVAPESKHRISAYYPMETEQSRKPRISKNSKVLRVDTQEDGSHLPSTPRTSRSTPDSVAGSVITTDIRNTSDIRSPGQKKTPMAATMMATPDFITQTDRYGNAVTPRSENAIQSARKEHPSAPKPHLHVDRNGKLSANDDEMEGCTEAFFDTLRIMCCCLDPDDSPTQASKSSSVPDVPALKEEQSGLLPTLHPDDRGKKCLVLDLDETLVHSSFRAVPGADFVIPVQIEDVVHFVYVAKRPGVDEFLIEMAKHYEIVIYTASLNKYADPLLDLLDPHQTIRMRLFRESCVYYEGSYVKDLSLLDRDLSQAIIIDNSPNSYVFHPENAIDCSSFIDDPRDRELDQISAFLKGIKDVKDVRGVAPRWRDWPDVAIEEQ
jgi:RNA polymerase II subunit A small phosphatase-like protein